jgi:hypothetical protein
MGDLLTGGQYQGMERRFRVNVTYCIGLLKIHKKYIKWCVTRGSDDDFTKIIGCQKGLKTAKNAYLMKLA